MPIADSTATPLVLTLFGPFAAHVNGLPLPRLRGRKGEALLALLILRHGRDVLRTWLAGLLWPDRSTGQGLATLRRYLTDLRHALGPEAARLQSPTSQLLRLDLAGATVDVVAFDAALERGDRAALEAAVRQYQGPLLEGWEEEEWLFQERAAREQAYLHALEHLAEHARAGRDLETAERHLRQAAMVDPLRESAQRSLMEVLAASGNYAAAIGVYQDLRERLHREMSAAPDPETTARFHQLRAEARRRIQTRTPIQVNPPGASPANRSPKCLLPEGTVTFLFTDIEGSTRLWEEQPACMEAALVRHDALAAEVIEQQNGVIVKHRGEGDSLFAVFANPADAVVATCVLHQAFLAEPWPTQPPLRVRMALHTGQATARDGDYFGPVVNRCVRVRAAAHGGQVLLSRATQELVRDQMPQGIGLRDLGAHRLKDLQQPEHLFQLLHPMLPADFPPIRSLEAFAHNLPVQLTRFIGRQEAMAAVKRLLSTSHLLTLTGSGGCGKTRLALQVAADLVEEHADGVWLVELAALSDPGLVPQTVAAALSVREEPGRPLTVTLTDHLRSRSLLLVLDNCEHLLLACAQLAESLLRSCPKLRILASSREGLGIGGEQTYRVPSLSLPDARHLPPLESLKEFEAVQLFADRARLSQDSFTVTSANAAAVVQVCERLDGIPLAIELAAARVKVLSVDKLHERLDDRFRLLTGGSRTALPRQQTLKALIDWSYDLLSEPERALLLRLSVFAGGWTLEAAEAVCAGEGIEEWEVLDLLTSLVEKSLVVYEERTGEGRYRLLETVRQYARDRLRESEEAEAVQERHRDWFLALANRAEPELWRGSQTEWLERLEWEHDNLRIALAWSEAPGQVEAGLWLGSTLGRFWEVRGYWGEGREQIARLLALPGAQAHTAARAGALQTAGMLALFQGDHGTAQALMEESVAIRRELGSEPDTAFALYALGCTAHGRGDYAAARAPFEECLMISRALGYKEGIARSLRGLGAVAHAQGDPGAAWVLQEESLSIFRQLGDRYHIAMLLRNLGAVARDQEEYGEARALHEESLAVNWDLGDRRSIAGNLVGLAVVAVAQAQRERAARLFAAAERLREAIGAPLPPADRAEHERSLVALRAALGEKAFAAAWAEGRALSLEESVALALDERQQP